MVCDQCGYCGGWYDLTRDRMPGVCPVNETRAVNGMYESEW